MADVFISYACKDKGFARDLHDAHKEAKRDPWIDWYSIPYSAQWKAEILAAIDAADNLVFIISPDSLGSWMCGEEVAHAVASKKRIVTILYHPVESEKLFPSSVDGTVQVYAMDIHELMALARESMTSQPSIQNCQKYFHVDKCPEFPSLPWW